MKIPHDQTRLISRPSNTNRVAPADRAERMDRICWATTDNTSMLIRLNSSKQPHAPVCNVKYYYEENIKNTIVEYFTNLLLQTTKLGGFKLTWFVCLFFLTFRSLAGPLVYCTERAWGRSILEHPCNNLFYILKWFTMPPSQISFLAIF